MRRPNRYAPRIIILVLTLSSFSLAQNPPPIRELEQGKPIERELAGGGVHAYSIQLTAGQFLSVIVDQRGIDVVVILFDPKGKQVAEVDSPNGTQGPEHVLLVAKAAGIYRLEVRSLEKKALTGYYERSVEGLPVAGCYEVMIESLRAATPKEELEHRTGEFAAVLAATKTNDELAALLAKEKELVTVPLMRALYEHARVFRSQRKFPQALDVSRLGLSLAEQIGDKTGVGDFLYNIGYVLYWQRDSAQALEYLQKSLTLREQLGEKMKAGDSSNVIGSLYSNQQNNPTKALEYYQKSLALYQETGDRQGEIGTLNNIALVFRNQGNHIQALEAYQKAVSVSEVIGNKGLRAQMLAEIASTHFFGQANNSEALKYYQQSLELEEELGDKAQIALTLNRIGLVQRDLGNFPQALEAAQRSWRLTESLGNKASMADVMMTIGLIYNAQGNTAQALDPYQKSLTFAEEAGAKPLIANALEKIGGIHHSRGDIAQAIEYYQKSLKLNEESGNKRQIAFTTITIGEVHRYQGNYSQALEYFHRSLKLSEELGNKFQVANALNKIGIVHFYQGNFREALEYFKRGLALREEIGHAGGTIDSLNNIGDVNRSLGNYIEALKYYEKSLQLGERTRSKGGIRDALNNLGHVYRLQGNNVRALEYGQKSLALSEELGHQLVIPETLDLIARIQVSDGHPSEALESATRAVAIARRTNTRYQLLGALTTMGSAYRALNQIAEARKALEEAISVVESTRTMLVGQEVRAFYLATVREPYEIYIDLLMQMHSEHPAEGNSAIALQVGERSRARSLLEALSEAHADIREGVDSHLLQWERTLQQRLNVAAERQTRMLLNKHTEEQVAAVEKEIDAITAEFQNVQAQIRQRSPRYAALTQPAPLDLKEIQALLDGDTLLLEYALGEERSYLWAVTPTSIKSFELPKRSEIEAEVRRAVSLLSDGKQWSTSNKIASDYAEVSDRLSRMLIDPVAEQLKGKRLLIVGDGALHYLPFGALPAPRSQGSEGDGLEPKSGTGKSISKPSGVDSRLPLIAEHEIVTVPSASTLAVLRRETVGRKRASKTVAVLADPVFERDDERLTLAGKGSTPGATGETDSETTNSRSLLERAFGLGLQLTTAEGGQSREILRIQRLPFTRREAEAIVAVAPAGEGMKALDFRASRETATSPELAQYRIVHFATHGLLNSEQPDLSGIVLSLVNEAGQPVNGFLRLHEIYNLRLNADLVVLSACQTGLGKEIRGEGLVGLTRGFMYAGSPRVIASLWKVGDVATSELMKIFYRGMLREGMRPAAALRAAQVEMWKQKRWHGPYYWAAFQVQGEWN